MSGSCVTSQVVETQEPVGLDTALRLIRPFISKLGEAARVPGCQTQVLLFWPLSLRCMQTQMHCDSWSLEP